MKEIKSIIYENGGQTLVINIGDKSEISYKGILKRVDSKLMFEYLHNLFGIIEDWKKEYINTKMIDGDEWKLSIIYFNGNKKEYRGKSDYPINFEAFERFNQKLIDEVQNG